MCPCLNCSSGKDNVSSYAQQTQPSREVCVMYTTVSPAQIAEPIIGGDRLALVVNLVFDKGAPCTLAPPGEYDAPICVALSDNVARHHQQPVIAINQAMSRTHDCIHRSSWISLLMYSTRTSTGQHSFAAYGPRTWNWPPTALWSPELPLSSFKRQLKTHSSVPALDSAGCSCGCRVPSSHRCCCDCTPSSAPTTNV